MLHKGQDEVQRVQREGVWYEASSPAALARLCQVQVMAESYPTGPQIFELHQHVKMGKVEVGLAFNGSSNHYIITKEYVARRKLKKVSATILVIGFGSPEAKVGELYEVPHKARGKGNICIRAVAASSCAE